MDIGAIFLLLAVLVLIVIYIYNPFMHTKSKMVQEEHLISNLLAEHERVINAIQEMDFDNTLGKIPSEDYPVMRRELMVKGGEILKQLDEIKQSTQNEGVENLLKKTLSSSRDDSGSLSMPGDMDEDEELEALIAASKLSKKSKSSGFCSKCGSPLLASDVFCPKCGNSTK